MLSNVIHFIYCSCNTTINIWAMCCRRTGNRCHENAFLLAHGSMFLLFILGQSRRACRDWYVNCYAVWYPTNAGKYSNPILPLFLANCKWDQFGDRVAGLSSSHHQPVLAWSLQYFDHVPKNIIRARVSDPICFVDWNHWQCARHCVFARCVHIV